MNSARAIGARLFTAVFLAAGLVVATPIQAEVVAPDQVIGPQPEERPLNVPDRMTDGEGTRLPLGTPDQLDADIRESDERASTSF
jgi:hypothetical protein